MSNNRIIVFGDEYGLAVLRDVLTNEDISAVVYSSKRPEAKKEVEEWKKKHGCKGILQPQFKNDPGKYYNFIEELKTLNPDLGLCFSYDSILKPEVLNIFRKGIFNIHGSLLPRYRGANVVNWVLINGEKETGVTIHKMTNIVDAGPIVAQKKLAISFFDTALSLRTKIAMAAKELITETLPLLYHENINIIEQDESNATIVRRRKPEDGYIDWSRPAIEIYNLIRALVSPWPGAWYWQEDQKIIIDYFMHLDDVERLQKERIGRVVK
ncbi:MAG: methionyl-tRNA formyltransferase [Peptococcaceae bacterium]|jgi:UDP-4-amino-4-deoxy-L-arabinose formyltransferase/UDP-glucuronic acid dehydrogenase (UDP-4-keto-hexauronic acid decarboxylating)|nr:methionyl-tRNA formyltransferase [Peptococcaceae bacterium]